MIVTCLLFYSSFILSIFSFFFFFFFSSRRRHTRWTGDWSSDVCSSDLQRFDLFDFLVARKRGVIHNSHGLLMLIREDGAQLGLLVRAEVELSCQHPDLIVNTGPACLLRLLLLALTGLSAALRLLVFTGGRRGTRRRRCLLVWMHRSLRGLRRLTLAGRRAGWILDCESCYGHECGAEKKCGPDALHRSRLLRCTSD